LDLLCCGADDVVENGTWEDESWFWETRHLGNYHYGNIVSGSNRSWSPASDEMIRSMGYSMSPETGSFLPEAQLLQTLLQDENLHWAADTEDLKGIQRARVIGVRNLNRRKYPRIDAVCEEVLQCLAKSKAPDWFLNKSNPFEEFRLFGEDIWRKDMRNHFDELEASQLYTWTPRFSTYYAKYKTYYWRAVAEVEEECNRASVRRRDQHFDSDTTLESL
jgi:hypothetical protein